MLTIAPKHRALRRPPPLRAGAPSVWRGEDGFLLIEVMISTMLVALIVIATLTGFDVVDRATAEERRHAQAVALAAQSQEQLRSDSAAALSELELSPRKYTRALNGTTYTVTQEAKAINSGATSTGCAAGETSAQTGLSILINSMVTWSKQQGTNRAAVQEESVIAPPAGSALEVDVQNGRSPVAGVSGVTVLVTYFPAESKTSNTLTATTGAAGCVVFTGLPTTKATIAIQQKANFVTTSGLLKYPTKENFALAPNVTTHDEVVYDEGGRVTGEFSWKGNTGEAAPYGHTETITGDTFVAFNSSLPPEPHFEVGSSSFKYESGGEEPYKALTGTYAAAASTPAATLYLSGDLFPFSGPWQVYGGDCPKDNNIETVTTSTEKLKPEPAVVEPGKATVVKVPLSYVRVAAYKGNIYDKEAVDAKGYPVTITTQECGSEKTPNNASAANLVHSQNTNGEGHLEHPFQPYGKYKLCVYNATLKNRYVWSYNNTTASGSTLTVFPSEKTKEQWEALEAENRAKWKTLEKEGKLTKEARKAKEEAELKERTESEAKRKNETEKEPYGYVIESGQSSC
jgi:Tfp pilus assembly protein PilV